MKLSKLFSLFLILAVVVFISCDSDDDSPTTGSLKGHVVFHGDWPDSGTVQLSVFTNWNNEETDCYWCAQSAGGPPAYYTHSEHFQDPDPANLSDADTLSFEMDGITLGDYEVIVAGWRNPTPYGDVECDEPVIGMYGADPATGDTIPASISFTGDSPDQDILFHAYFERIPDCGDVTSGTISGMVVTEDDWPEGGLLALLSTQSVTGWTPPAGVPPTGYYSMNSEAENGFEFEVGLGSYTVSIWTNSGGPGGAQWCGSYGINTAAPDYDAIPEFVVLSEDNPNATGIDINVMVPPPHFIGGEITFNGERPAEGLAIALSPTPQLMGPPAGWFVISDSEQTAYGINGIAEGSHYVLLYNNTSGPGAILYGFYDADNDGTADALIVDSENWGYGDIDISGNAP